MSRTPVSEADTVQFPMVRHAGEIGWEPVPPREAEAKRDGVDSMLFKDELAEKLGEFNPWLGATAVDQVIEKLAAVPATIEGNRQMLAWMRGEQSWYDEAEKRMRSVQLIDFDTPDANVFHVSWEWRIKPPARKSNRADLVFLINGIPVAIVENKNPKDSDAIELGIRQLRRYEKETPELMRDSQLFNITNLIDYWYGVTWNISSRYMARWKSPQEQGYESVVQSFFDRVGFLRTLKDWILFYDEDGETKKSVLRQHQQRAVDCIVNRCTASDKNRGLIWHTQGSGKTFTLLIAARVILEQKSVERPTVILIVDRTELEGQIGAWAQKLIDETRKQGIEVWRAQSKDEIQDFLKLDKRGLVLSMIHKFEGMPKDINTRNDIYIFIDEAHRSVARELGSALMGAMPRATIVGFTGTPIAKTAHGAGTFKIFSADDEAGYLDKYSIAESIEDETTLPIHYSMVESDVTVPEKQLEKEFFALAEQEGVTDSEELDRVLKQAVNLRSFLTADDRVEKVAAFVAEHFKNKVEPLGYKAILVGVNREACAKYKYALDQHLPQEWSAAVYTRNANDTSERPWVARFQLSPEKEEDVRSMFRKEDEMPKILIVTDKLLTGYDAPLLYCMYLDKPMQNHVLLQAIARVNRPYVGPDDNDTPKSTGLIIDFIGVLQNLKRAFRFDSADVSGVIKNLDVLMQDFRKKIAQAKANYCDDVHQGEMDKWVEKILHGRFMDRVQRRSFWDEYKEIERLWEILSPSAELGEHVETFKYLAYLYKMVRNVYSYPGRLHLAPELARKTRRLVQESTDFEGLERLINPVSFDKRTIEALRDEPGLYETKISSLRRGLIEELQEDKDLAIVLKPLQKRVEQVRKDLEERKIDAHQAWKQLELLAAEKDEAVAQRQNSELSPRAFSVYWNMKNNAELKSAGIDAKDLARTADNLLERFPHAAVNPDERRQMRLSLYSPLLHLEKEARSRMVEEILGFLLDENADADE